VLCEHVYAPNIETLTIVVRAQRADLLQIFIDRGVDLNMRDNVGSTLLHTAIFQCRIPDEPRLVLRPPFRNRRPAAQHLVRTIEHVPQQVSARCMSVKVDKSAPEEIVRCLIGGGGADVNALNALGRTPLAGADQCPPAVQQMLVDGGGK
jgi:hypothetical protein